MTNDNDARGALTEAVEIRLRNGQTALISPQDAEKVSVIEWKVNGKGYAVRSFDVMAVGTSNCPCTDSF